MGATKDLIRKFRMDNAEIKQLIPQSVLDKVDREPEEKLSRKVYEKEKLKLQVELGKLQKWVKETGQRVVIVFEGRDAAGKGGTIKRFTEHLNPRMARVVALEKPTDYEKGQWYFQRYIKELPTKGEMVFFDRSWYNRAGVEKVMKFCTAEEHKDFLNQVPRFEKMLTDDGVVLIKFWFSVSRHVQLKRFFDRAADPLKQWKLSEIDYASLAKWNDYSRAAKSMFEYTDTNTAPWIQIRSDDKKKARLNAMRYCLEKINYTNRNLKNVFELDSEIIQINKP